MRDGWCGMSREEVHNSLAWEHRPLISAQVKSKGP